MKHLHDSALALMSLNDTSVIICENGDVIITGLGNSRNFANGASRATEKQQNNSTDAKLDVFNFGLLLDEMFTKKPSCEISRRSQYSQAPSYVPPSYVNLFINCLNSRPDQRPTFTQILEELQGMTLKSQLFSLQGKSVYRPSNQTPSNALDVKRFKGIIPAFYACYDKNGNVSEEGTKGLTKWLLQNTGVRGLYVGGSSGEGIYQTVEERKKVLEWVCEAKGNTDQVIIAHVGCNNLKDSQELATHAQEVCHVDAIASIPPIYFKLPEYGIADYWKGISDAAKTTPFIIYNIPQLAGVNLTTSLLKTMLDKCPNTLIGVKNSSVPTQDIQMWRDCAMQAPYNRTDDNFIVFNGPDEQLVSGLIIGANGGIGGTYASMPELMIKAFNYVTDATNPNNELAMEIQNDICRIIYKMGEAHGNLYSVMKEVIRLSGGPDCGDVRPPLTAHTEEDMVIIRKAKEMIDAAIEKYSKL